METLCGTKRNTLSRADLLARTAAYPYIWIDLGTGDGRYVRHQAVQLPRWFVIGVDASREPLRDASRRAAAKSLFVIANAYCLPPELHGIAQRISINFPWGSLLRGLVDGDTTLLSGIAMLARPDALLEIRLNGSALHELDITPDTAATRVAAHLEATGWQCNTPTHLHAAQLRGLPSSWARRLVHSPHPWAVELRAVRG
jgi:16S rRNA (adenine(1408)-N(1))-methyltransferase